MTRGFRKSYMEWSSSITRWLDWARIYAACAGLCFGFNIVGLRWSLELNVLWQVPWTLPKRGTSEVLKRVYVCPVESCLHHNACHALGDLVGIRKHYRRKHSSEKQWRCEKCSKGYAVQSDYKAHVKSCGARGHSCDCGRVFSRWVQRMAGKPPMMELDLILLLYNIRAMI
jgi:hypothetical protein